MKILSAELVSPNKRERISGGDSYEFETIENVKKDDYFKVKVDGFYYDFKSNGIKVEGNNLKITAIEVGYWAKKLDTKGVDLRTIIGYEVIPIIDSKEKSNINERSCWC